MENAMTDRPGLLSPLLGSAFPPNGIAVEYLPDLLALQSILDAVVAPAAADVDRIGRYPTCSIAALKRTGFLKSVIPREFGGRAVPHRVSMEAQLRMAIADPAVAQIYKVHDEIIREILIFCPAALKPRLSRAVVEDSAIVGLAVAEAGRTVTDPLTTTALPDGNGGFIVHGQKIYTTGAAEADYIATWAFNPQAPGVTDNPLAGMQLNLIPPSTTGITIRRDWDALGQRGTDSGTIIFDHVRTDPDWNATIPGRFSPPHASLRYQLGFAAIMTGIGIAALREAAAFVSTRSRPWPSAGVDNAADDPHTRKIMGELVTGLVAAYVLMSATADLLDAAEQGAIGRTDLAIPVYAAKAAATKAALEATSEIYTLMGTRAVARQNGFDRHWRNARTLSLHDPVSWKYAEIGRHVLTGWDPEPGLYQ